MSQTPVTSTSHADANINPSVTSHHTLENESIEASPMALAISNETELNAFPFMKLAVEIRLEIYSYLLIAFPSRAPSQEKASRGVVLEIHQTRCGCDDERIIYAEKHDRSRVYPSKMRLNPQILRTCKAIHRKAAAILYGENIFCFWFRRLPSNELRQPEWDAFKASCEKLYQHPAGRWDDEFDGRLRLFAPFLLQIGQQNAKSLRKLKFSTPVAFLGADCPKAGWFLQAITQLLKSYVPGVRQVKIRRGTGDWDEFEMGPFTPSHDTLDDGENKYSHNSRVSIVAPGNYRSKPPPEIRREQEEAMHRAIADMVQQITWLKLLSFAGFDEKDSTYQKMEELQALVKARR